MNILVVDGSELIRTRLAERIRNVAGVSTVVTAECIRQGLSFLRSGLFDLAFLELHLPDGTSSPIVGVIKQTSKSLQVAIYSNDANEVNRRLCQKAGADWFFDKSLEFEQILHLTATLAASRVGGAVATGQSETVNPTDSQRSERTEV